MLQDNMAEMYSTSLKQIPLWSKETLTFPLPQQILKLNKQLISVLVAKFQRKNPRIKDFYIGGSSALILQDYLAKSTISDIDIYCNEQEVSDVIQIDIIKRDIFPPGWRERVIEINGYKVISAFDVTCTMACCYVKPKISRRTALMWMLQEFDLNDIKQAIQAKLDSGIGVTESDFKSVEAFNKYITQDVIEKHKNPQEDLIKQLQMLQNV